MKTDRVSELRHQLAEYNERAKKHIDALPKDWGFQYSEVREATIIKGIGIIATALLELLEQGGEK